MKMFRIIIDLIKDHQPVSLTGTLTHSIRWLRFNKDKIYKNPHFSNLATDESPLQDGIAIYCVHGTADYPASFQKIAERLIKTGLPELISSINLVAFENRFHGKSIEYFADELLDKIEKNGHRHVVFMGHSRGGLVIAKAESKAKEKGITVHECYNLASPYGGSYLAIKPISFFSQSVKEMAIGSDFLQEINQHILHTKTKYYFFVAEKDSIVTPEASYSEPYKQGHPNSVIHYNRHGHLSLMSSHRVVATINQLLHQLQRHYFREEQATDLGGTPGGRFH